MSQAEPLTWRPGVGGKRVYACRNCQKYVEFDWKGFDDQTLKQVKALAASDDREMLETSFVFINEHAKSQNANGAKTEFGQMQAQFDLLDKIHEVVSGHQEVEHPLCSDCTHKVLKSLKNQLEDLGSEKRTYQDFISQNEPKDEGRDRRKGNAGIAISQEQIRAETRRLQQQLEALAEERSRLEVELEELDAEGRAMDELERRFFEDANDFRYEIENLSHQHAAVRQRIREISNHLTLMKRTNVFDDAFHIFYEDHFGTINGLRLGTLPSVRVESEEINAALGQCVLLLDVLSKRCSEFRFEGLELVPLGSQSQVRERSRQKKGAKWHNYLLNNGDKSFDKALDCLLLCVKQFSRWVYGADQNFKLAHAIRGHEIADMKGKAWVSIRCTGTSDEEWTRALKYMVIDLKYLLVWVARYNP